MSIIQVDLGSISDIGYTEYQLQYDKTDATATTFTLNSMKDRKLFVLIFSWYSSNSYAYTRYDGATCTGGNITKITNLLQVTARTQGTFYLVEPTSDTCEITVANSGYIKVFEAV